MQSVGSGTRTECWRSIAGCHDCTRMYELWLQKKAEKATKRKLLEALMDITLNDVAKKYKEHIEKVVSNWVA